MENRRYSLQVKRYHVSLEILEGSYSAENGEKYCRMLSRTREIITFQIEIGNFHCLVVGEISFVFHLYNLGVNPHNSSMRHHFL